MISDYAHARHAGNVGDVLKHVALTAALEAMTGESEPLLYVESHAADGIFPLGSNGEWTAGVQKLWPAPSGDVGPDSIGRWLQIVAQHGGNGERLFKYPGSPLVAQALLRPADRLLLHELDPAVAQVLRGALRGDLRAEVREADGLAALPAAVASAPRVLALVDPPYSAKAEWAEVAASVIAARAEAPGAALIVWYPIKALTRPRGLLAALTEGGVHGTVVELLATPLRLKRDRLAGSGLVLSGVPARAVAGLCAALPRLGAAMNTHGEWSAAQIGF